MANPPHQPITTDVQSTPKLCAESLLIVIVLFASVALIDVDVIIVITVVVYRFKPRVKYI